VKTDSELQHSVPTKRNPSPTTPIRAWRWSALVATAFVVSLASCGGEGQMNGPTSNVASGSSQLGAAASRPEGETPAEGEAPAKSAQDSDLETSIDEPPTFDYEPHDPALLSITLQRTHAYGDCPAYTITLRGDGSVSWHGQDFVAHRADESAHVEPAEVLALVQRFQSAHFAELKDEYFDALGDCPSFTLTLHVDGQTKRVENKRAGPGRIDAGLAVYAQERLDALAQAIDDLAGDEPRIGTSARRLEVRNAPHAGSH
jgi:Domain of unknown function (DUF6438)